MRRKTQAGHRPTPLKNGLRALVLVLALAAAVLTAGPAFATPAPQEPVSTLATCSSNGCNYKDRAATGCAAGAANFAQWKYMGYLVEHRYSPTCRTVWVRATYVDGNVYTFQAYLETKLAAGNVRQNAIWRGNTGWSNQYASQYLSRVVAVTSSGTHYGQWIQGSASCHQPAHESAVRHTRRTALSATRSACEAAWRGGGPSNDVRRFPRPGGRTAPTRLRR